jgi:dTDP-4-amino-4,6-dideoxygalactose transaminase
VGGEIKQAVLSVIDSRQYILGPQCRSFEAELADEILVPSHTAFPTIEAICCAEATPVFVTRIVTTCLIRLTPPPRRHHSPGRW